MWIVVGLGNPGKKYSKTRHNVGFMALDSWFGDDGWEFSKYANAFYIWFEVGGVSHEALKPQTFMNKSGEAVSYALRKHEVPPEKVIVVHDDADLGLGDMRISFGRGSAGHNGIKSIEDSLGAREFVRIRVGVSNESEEEKFLGRRDYVLSNFSQGEMSTLRDIFEKVENAIISTIENGVEESMNKFN